MGVPFSPVVIKKGERITVYLGERKALESAEIHKTDQTCW